MHDAYMPGEIKSRCTVADDPGSFLKDVKLTCDRESNFSFAREHNWDRIVDEYIALYEQMQS